MMTPVCLTGVAVRFPIGAPRSPWLCFEQRIWSLHSSIEAGLRPSSLKPRSSDGFSACCWWNSHCTALGCSCVHVSGLTGSHSARATQTHLCYDLARSPRAVVVGALWLGSPAPPVVEPPFTFITGVGVGALHLWELSSQSGNMAE